MYKRQALNRPEVIGRIKYDLYAITNKEAYDALIEKANKIAKHRGYYKPITSIADIIEYNKELSDKQLGDVRDRMNFDPMNAVSYTHLDVYKRQMLLREVFHLNL